MSDTNTSETPVVEVDRAMRESAGSDSPGAWADKIADNVKATKD